MLVFEECDVSSMLLNIDPTPPNGVGHVEEAAPQPAPVKSGRLNPFRRKKPRKHKGTVNGTKEVEKETEST